MWLIGAGAKTQCGISNAGSSFAVISDDFVKNLITFVQPISRFVLKHKEMSASQTASQLPISR